MTRSVSQKAEEVLQHHAKSFRWASYFLSDAKRRDAAVAYAFCRLVDDIVDEATDEDEARRGLDEVESMLRATVEPSPLVAAFVEVADRTGFGLLPAFDLILGMRSDLGPVRLKTSEELSLYCYRVAGTVGLMMCGILGVGSERARSYAVDLGVAMQLTNISRDVLEDAGRNRVYLPAKLLERHGITQDRFLASLEGNSVEREHSRRAVSAAVFDLLVRADTKYESGAEGYQFLPPRARLSIMVAADLYQQIGILLREEFNCDPLVGRVRVAPSRKVLLTARALAKWSLLSARSLAEKLELAPLSRAKAT
jgi:phytoene synthase